MINEALYTSRSEEWETPKHIFEKLNDEFHFTCDACASEENHKCEMYFTEEQNALFQEWGGCTFCNPPYGKKIELFVKKAYEESLKGKTVVLLIPSRTDTKWFHDYVYHKAEIRFIRGRLKYGDGKGTAPFPTLIAVYRNRWWERKEKENGSTHDPAEQP